MNLRDVQIFAEAATRGSFTAVARARGIDPSSVSRAVAGLEADLGVRLFDRSTRRISLTEAGQLYLARVVPLVEEIGRLADKARDARSQPTGTLRISAPVALGQRVILPRLRHFRTEHPGLRVECLLTDASPDLAGERIDLALRLRPASSGALVSTELARTGTRLVASPAYLDSHPPILAPVDLARQDCLMPAEAEFRARWTLADRAGREVVQPVAGAVAVTSLGGLHAAVREGLGIGLLPGWLAEPDLLSGELVRVLPDWETRGTGDGRPGDGAVWVAYPARDILPYKVRAAIEFLRRAV